VLPVWYKHRLLIKSDAMPVTGRGGLWGCELLRISDFLQKLLIDGFIPRNIFVYSFLLEGE
jgi:hypothetical protein